MPIWLTRLRLRLRATFSRRHDAELRHELLHHLQLLEDEYRAQGLSPAEARRAAHLEFGNATLIQETSHDLFSFRALEELAHDLAYALRAMKRSAGFTLIAVCSLALGIGAVTATFAVIDAFLLRGLPVPAPDQLVAFSVSNSAAWRRWPYAVYERWRDAPEGLFDAAASLTVERFNVSTPQGGENQDGKVRVSLVSGTYFQVLQAPVPFGRALTPADDRAPGAHPVAVISAAFWEGWFGNAADVIGRHIVLNRVPYEIVGVTGRGFTGEWIGAPTDVWIPLAMHGAVSPDAPSLLDDRWGLRSATMRVIARRRPGVSRDAAEAVANVVYQRFNADKVAVLGDSADAMRDRKQHIDLLEATQGYSPERSRYVRPLMILSAIVVLVLVVACANFANLLLGRAQIRQPEYSVRLALGAGRWRLVRQALTECALLAVIAGVLGLIAAQWATTALLKQLATTVQPVEFVLHLDARVLALNGACVLLVMLVGLWPGLRGARTAVTLSFLQRVAAAETGRRARVSAGQLLLAGQLALCTVLLVGAGLFLRTVMNLQGQHLGFDRNVLLVSVAPRQAGYSPEAAAALIARIKERLQALPGITGVVASSNTLLNNTTYWIDGSEQLRLDNGTPAAGLRWTFSAVSPAFFHTVGMTLHVGREFAPADVNPPADRVVINRTLATFLFGSTNPIGRRIGLHPGGRMQEIIGVVEDVKQTSPRDAGLGVVYQPLGEHASHVVLAVPNAWRRRAVRSGRPSRSSATSRATCQS